MRVCSVQTLSFTQPAVPIHAKRFAGVLENVLTTVRTDDGREAYSMARAHGGQSGAGISQAIIKSLAPRALGQDALNRERIWQSMLELEPAGYVPVFAISALDVALWDLAGKALGVPICQLLGGRRERIRAYASSAALCEKRSGRMNRSCSTWPRVITMPKPSGSGVYWKAGVSGMHKTAVLCEALGFKVASHHAASPLMNWANLHVLCGVSNADWMEVLVPEAGYDFGLQRYVAPDADGYLTVPHEPGIGVALDWDYIRAHTVPGSALTAQLAG